MLLDEVIVGEEDDVYDRANVEEDEKSLRIVLIINDYYYFDEENYDHYFVGEFAGEVGTHVHDETVEQDDEGRDVFYYFVDNRFIYLILLVLFFNLRLQEN